MIYVIGDIHGEYDKLADLIKIIDKNASKYIFLGDYLDKGVKIKETIGYLMDLADNKECIFLAGDHEYAWLKFIDGEERFLEILLKYGGLQTLKGYLGRDLSETEARLLLVKIKDLGKIFGAHSSFFSKLKFYHLLNKEFLCVHAGINPDDKDLPLEKHNTEELVFIRDKFIHSEFLFQGRKIIFGHTAFIKPYIDKYKIGIDSGAVYKTQGFGRLIAFNINNKEFVTNSGETEKVQN